MIELLWWHWAVLGFGLVLAELIMPSFVIIWFGLGGFLVMAALLIAPALSLTAQVLIWTASSIAMMVLWFRVFRRSYHKILIGRSSANVIGEIGMITAPVEPFKNGKVRFQKPLVGSDLWDCSAEEKIEIGARVRVASIDGNIVTVKKVEG